MKRWAPLACLVALVTGCAPAGGVLGLSHSATCEDRDLPGSPMVLLAAQAVPSASLIPCIEALPVGWTYGNMSAHNGMARFTLDSDREGMEAVKVILTPGCDVRGATSVPTDEPGTRRFERIGDLPPQGGFTGWTYYTFPGGCVTYEMILHGRGRAGPVTEVSLALGFISRDTLREALRDASDGRLRLDP